MLRLVPGEYRANMQIVGADQALPPEQLPDFLKAMQGALADEQASTRNFCLTEAMLQEARTAIANEGRLDDMCLAQPPAINGEPSVLRLRCRLPFGGKNFALMAASVGSESINLTMKLPIPGMDAQRRMGMHITINRVGDCTDVPAPEAEHMETQEEKP